MLPPLTDKQRALRDYINANPGTGAIIAAKHFGWGEAVTKKRLRSLRDRGEITWKFIIVKGDDT